MGLFSKRCVVCQGKLPDKRRYKGLCIPCGYEYGRITGQLEDTVRIVTSTKTARTGFDRCLFGLELTEDYARFVNRGIVSYPEKRSREEMVAFFKDHAMGFVETIRTQNEKRKYDKKVGVPTLAHYKKLRTSKSELPADVCRGCWTNKKDNAAGYCRECIIRATTMPRAEIAILYKLPQFQSLKEEALAKALLNFKLDNSVDSIFKLERHTLKAD